MAKEKYDITSSVETFLGDNNLTTTELRALKNAVITAEKSGREVIIKSKDALKKLAEILVCKNKKDEIINVIKNFNYSDETTYKEADISSDIKDLFERYDSESNNKRKIEMVDNFIIDIIKREKTGEKIVISEIEIRQRIENDSNFGELKKYLVKEEKNDSKNILETYRLLRKNGINDSDILSITKKYYNYKNYKKASDDNPDIRENDTTKYILEADVNLKEFLKRQGEIFERKKEIYRGNGSSEYKKASFLFYLFDKFLIKIPVTKNISVPIPSLDPLTHLNFSEIFDGDNYFGSTVDANVKINFTYKQDEKGNYVIDEDDISIIWSGKRVKLKLKNGNLGIDDSTSFNDTAYEIEIDKEGEKIQQKLNDYKVGFRPIPDGSAEKGYKSFKGYGFRKNGDKYEIIGSDKKPLKGKIDKYENEDGTIVKKPESVETTFNFEEPYVIENGNNTYLVTDKKIEGGDGRCNDNGYYYLLEVKDDGKFKPINYYDLISKEGTITDEYKNVIDNLEKGGKKGEIMYDFETMRDLNKKCEVIGEFFSDRGINKFLQRQQSDNRLESLFKRNALAFSLLASGGVALDTLLERGGNLTSRGGWLRTMVSGLGAGTLGVTIGEVLDIRLLGSGDIDIENLTEGRLEKKIEEECDKIDLNTIINELVGLGKYFNEGKIVNTTYKSNSNYFAPKIQCKDYKKRIELLHNFVETMDRFIFEGTMITKATIAN